MTKHASAKAERTLARALDALARAYEEAAAAVATAPDSQQALVRATELFNALRVTYGKAAELRAQAVTRIWEDEELSLAALAQRVGISKTRADQLIRAAKASKVAKEG